MTKRLQYNPLVGDAPIDRLNAYQDTLDALQKTIREARKTVPHGRNFDGPESTNAARTEHFENMRKLAEVEKYLLECAEEWADLYDKYPTYSA